MESSDNLSPIPRIKSKRIPSHFVAIRGNEWGIGGIISNNKDPWEKLDGIHRSNDSIQFKIQQNSLISHHLKSQHSINALLAGIITLLLIGLTIWFSYESISAFIQHSNKNNTNYNFGTKIGPENSLRVVEMSIWPILVGVEIGIILWLRIRRIYTPTQYLIPLLASLTYLTHFSMAIVNLIFSLLWNDNLAQRCTWGIDVVWNLSTSGDYCLGAGRGDIGLSWVIAGSVRLVVTTLIGTLWLFLLKRFHDSLQLVSQPIPETSAIGTSEYLPPMPLHSDHYRFRSSSSSYPTSQTGGGEYSNSWSNWIGSKFWSGFGYILGVEPYSHPLQQTHIDSESPEKSSSSRNLLENNLQNQNRFSWPNGRGRVISENHPEEEEVGEFGEKDIMMVGTVTSGSSVSGSNRIYQKVDLDDPIFIDTRYDGNFEQSSYYDGGAILKRSKTEPIEPLPTNSTRNGKNKLIESEPMTSPCKSTPAKQYKKLFETFYAQSGPSTIVKPTPISPPKFSRAPHPSRPNDSRTAPRTAPSNLQPSDPTLPPRPPIASTSTPPKPQSYRIPPNNFLTTQTFPPVNNSASSQIRTGSSGSTNGSLIFVRMSDGKLVRKLSTIASEASGEVDNKSSIMFDNQSIRTGLDDSVVNEEFQDEEFQDEESQDGENQFDDNFEDEFEIRRVDRRRLSLSENNRAWLSDQTL